MKVNSSFSNSQVPPDFIAKKIQKAPKESSFLRDVTGPIGVNILLFAMGFSVYGLINHLQAIVLDRKETWSITDCTVAVLFPTVLSKISVLYETEAKLDFIKKKGIQITHPNEIESKVQKKAQAIVIFESRESFTPDAAHAVITSMEGLREKGILPIVIQIGSVHDMSSSLEKINALGVCVHGIVIGAHGEEGYVCFSEQERMEVSDMPNLVRLSQSVNSLQTNCPPWIVFVSCLAAAESNIDKSVARAVSQAIPKSTVIASSGVVGLSPYRFSSDRDARFYIRFVEELYPNTGQKFIFPSVEFRDWRGRDETKIFLDGKELTQSSD